MGTRDQACPTAGVNVPDPRKVPFGFPVPSSVWIPTLKFGTVPFPVPTIRTWVTALDCLAVKRMEASALVVNIVKG
jgi:hypothetical protein